MKIPFKQFKFEVGLAAILVIFSCFVLFKQINSNYADFSEGNYLYISKQIAQGIFPYRDILIPHPPILFFWGAFIMKFVSHIFVLRGINLVIYLISVILLYRLVVVAFKDRLLALVASVCSLFLPLSMMWWPTFTPEILLRLFILVALNLLIPLSTVSHRKIWVVTAVSLLMFFTKYNAILFVIAVFIVLLTVNKHYALRYIFGFGVLVLLIVGVLQFGTQGAYLHDTLFVRGNIPLKSDLGILRAVSVPLLYYLPLLTSALLLCYKALRQKQMNTTLIYIVSILYFIGFFLVLFEGTYSYILYPIEPLLLVGAVYGAISLFSRKKRIFFKSKLAVIILYFNLFLSCLTFIYFLQIFSYRLYFATNKHDALVMEKIVTRIEKTSNPSQLILTPPYLAYLSNRTIDRQFSDTFMWLMLYLYDKNEQTKVDYYLSSITSAIKLKRYPVIIMDWRYQQISEINAAVTSNYKLVAKYTLLINENETLEVYVPQKGDD
ncbi:glycosyltransferase family 39 protein [Candidatus Roizmanbacteria bacterium]|nr:glycosyltransferase family 39 protein [Candidatus Roizmanbacteria bacterium]